MKKINILMGLIAAVLLLAGLCDVQAKTIKVGAAINMTGPASSWGKFHEKGQRDYFRYVNEVKGGVYGNKIEMIS
ncbi:MAG: ABC transporter substrate-binding protein, partial [Smithella sp.]